MANTNDLDNKNFTVKEVNRVAEITDAMNRLRYRVVLNRFLKDGVLQFQILVINYFVAVDPLVIFERPNDGMAPLSDYDQALSIYKDCIKNYGNLINAESKDYQDINVYKDKIDYKMTCPECCATCQFSKKHLPYNSYSMSKSVKLKCVNPENRPSVSDISINKTVELFDLFILPFGICNNYKKRNAVMKDPGPISRIVEHEVNAVFKNLDRSKYIKNIVQTSVSSELSIHLENSDLVNNAVNSAVNNTFSNIVFDGNLMTLDYNNDGVIDENDFNYLNEMIIDGDGA